MPLPLLIVPLVAAAASTSAGSGAIAGGVALCGTIAAALGFGGGYWFRSRKIKEKEAQQREQQEAQQKQQQRDQQREQQLAAALQTLQEQNEALIKLITTSEFNIDLIKKALKTTDTKFDTIVKEISSATGSLSRATTSLESTGVLLKGTTNELTELKTALINKTVELEQQRKNFELISMQITLFANSLETKHTELLLAFGILETYKVDIVDKLAKIDELKNLITKLEDENTRLIASNDSKQHKIEALEPRIAHLAAKLGLFYKSISVTTETQAHAPVFQ